MCIKKGSITPTRLPTDCIVPTKQTEIKKMSEIMCSMNWTEVDNLSNGLISQPIWQKDTVSQAYFMLAMRESQC